MRSPRPPATKKTSSPQPIPEDAASSRRPARSPHAPAPSRPPGPRRAALQESEPLGLRPARKGRGARANPTGRFERARIEPDLEALSDWLSGDDPVGSLDPADPREGADHQPSTQAIPDPSRTALTTNDSPDIPFDTSLNPYRGCEHGCAYCYARPTHEYLGYSAGLDFETRILVKERAPELLRRSSQRRGGSPRSSRSLA